MRHISWDRNPRNPGRRMQHMSNQQPVVIPLLPIIPALYPMNAQICPIVIAIPSQFGYSANKAKARGIWFDIPPFTAGKIKTCTKGRGCGCATFTSGGRWTWMNDNNGKIRKENDWQRCMIKLLVHPSQKCTKQFWSLSQVGWEISKLTELYRSYRCLKLWNHI